MNKGIKYFGATTLLAGVLSLVGCVDSQYGHGHLRYQKDDITGNYVNLEDEEEVRRNEQERVETIRRNEAFDERRREAWEESQRNQREFERWRRRNIPRDRW